MFDESGESSFAHGVMRLQDLERVGKGEEGDMVISLKRVSAFGYLVCIRCK